MGGEYEGYCDTWKNRVEGLKYLCSVEIVDKDDVKNREY